MKFMHRISFLLLTIGLSCSSLPSIASAGDDAARPNIILIMADDMGYEVMPKYGHPSLRTPNIDRIADDGMLFTRAYSQPICTPSRVQLMTGRYGHRNYQGFGYLDRSEVTFGNLMKQAGYATAIAGKWQLSGQEINIPNARDPQQIADFGFDEHCLWQLSFHRKEGERYANPRIQLNGEELGGLEDGYGPDVFNDFVLDFMQRHRDEPFFIYYPMALPHVPYWPTPDSAEWVDPDNRRPGDSYKGADKKFFYEMVEYQDKLVGKVLDQLDALGLSEDTIVIFTGDNGTEKSITTELPERTVHGSKGQTTDGGVHVPLMIQWPAVTEAGSVNDNIVDFSDFFTTLAEVAEQPLPEDRLIDGISFLPQLQGDLSSPRTWTYSYYWKGGRNGDKIIEFIRDDRWKLYRDGRLFDLENDIEESNALSWRQNPPAEAQASITELKQRYREVTGIKIMSKKSAAKK